MSRSYAPMLTSIWSDPDFCSWPAQSQRAFFLAASQPNVSYCGVVPYLPKRWARMAPDTTVAELDTAFRWLHDNGKIIIDDDHEEMWIRSFVKTNRVVEQPQLHASLSKDFAAIFSPVIREAFAASLDDRGRKVIGAQIPRPEGPPPPSPQPCPEGSPPPRPAGSGQEPVPEPEPRPEPSPEPAAPPNGSTRPFAAQLDEARGRPSHRAAAGQVLDDASRRAEHPLTPTERRRLKPLVAEWLDADYQPNQLAAAIATAAVRTGPGVEFEMRRQRTTTPARTTNRDNAAAAQNWLEHTR